eukprot:scaffold5816_cov267-Pinguiococcus_pyrenoidosus.AAC.20
MARLRLRALCWCRRRVVRVFRVPLPPRSGVEEAPVLFGQQFLQALVDGAAVRVAQDVPEELRRRSRQVDGLQYFSGVLRQVAPIVCFEAGFAGQEVSQHLHELLLGNEHHQVLVLGTSVDDPRELHSQLRRLAREGSGAHGVSHQCCLSGCDSLVGLALLVLPLDHLVIDCFDRSLPLFGPLSDLRESLGGLGAALQRVDSRLLRGWFGFCVV